MVRPERRNVTRRVTMATRKELIEAVGARYRASTVAERGAILDEFVAITGYHATTASTRSVC